MAMRYIDNLTKRVVLLEGAQVGVNDSLGRQRTDIRCANCVINETCDQTVKLMEHLNDLETGVGTLVNKRINRYKTNQSVVTKVDGCIDAIATLYDWIT